MLIDRYLTRSIFTGVLVATLILSGLFFFIDFAQELKHVGTADYTGWTAFYYVLLTMPQRLYNLAPSVILVGSLISLGAMASNSEIVVLRTSGMSTLRITRSVLQAGLVLAALVALMGELVVPPAMSLAQTIRVQALDQRILAGGIHGLWSRDGQRYINIGKVLPDKQLRDVNIYQLDADRNLVMSLSAEKVHREGDGWRMMNVNRSNISEQHVSSEHLQDIYVDNLVKVELFDVLEASPEDMSAYDLYQYSDYLDDNELDSDNYRLQFWIKLFTPITCLVMLLIALPLVFTAQARSGGIGQRIVIGLSIGILFYVLNRMINHMGLVYGLPPSLSAALPPLLAAGVVFYLLRRV